MNTVLLQGKVVGYPQIKRHKNIYYDYSGSLVIFLLDTEEICINHKTGEKYQRVDRHSIAVWGPLSDSVMDKLVAGSMVQIEGAVRVKQKKFYERYSEGDIRQVYNTGKIITVEANKIKVKRIRDKYYRDIQTGRY